MTTTSTGAAIAAPVLSSKSKRIDRRLRPDADPAHRAAADYQREWAKRNPEKVSALRRRYYLENKERLLAQNKARYELRRDEILEREHARYQIPEVAERKRETSRAWAMANKDVRKAHEQKRRAITRGAAAASFTAKAWKAMLAAYENRCAYCLGTFDKLEQDHVVPVKDGGTHTWDNIVPACRSCNAHKHTSYWTPQLRIELAA